MRLHSIWNFFVISFTTYQICKSYDCRDEISNCKAYGKAVCEDPVFFEWAYTTCPQTCEFCDYYNLDKMTYAPTTTHEPCRDLYEFCHMYRNACGRPLYKEWVSTNCQSTCRLCEPPLKPVLDGKTIG